MPQTVKKEKKQSQKRAKPELVGRGGLTANQLASWTSVAKRLLALGQSEAAVDGVFHTDVCPLGHKDHMTNAAICRTFFPGFATAKALKLIDKCRSTLITEIFIGQHVEELLEAHIAATAKPESSGKRRSKIPIEDQSKAIAERNLKAAFREENGLHSRGKMPTEMKDKCDRYVENHLEAAIKKTIADIEAAEGEAK